MRPSRLANWLTPFLLFAATSAWPHTFDRTVVPIKGIGNEGTFTITDQGRGFDWRSVLNAGPAALLRPHGRGILLAKLSSFDQLEYPGDGSQVIARLLL